MTPRLGLLALVLVLVAVLAAPIAVHAAQADRAGVIPPDECTAVPVTTDEAVEQLLAPFEVPDEGPAGLPTYVEDADELPAGEEVANRTQREIERLVEQFVACLNAGQLLRLMALFTEDGLPVSVRAPLATLSESAALTRDQKEQFLAQSLEAGLLQPEAVVTPEALWTALLDVEDAVELDDGLVGAIVVLDTTVDPRPEEPFFLVFAEEGGDWLIAGQVFIF